MATRQELEQLLNNPNARQMLDIIAKAEGVKHGYNTLFGNQRVDNLSAHPNIRKQFRQTDGKTNTTTAAGRYQFINGTWKNLQQKYGLSDFSPRNQDIGALALIAGRGALNDVVKGNFRSAVSKLGQEWASLPSSQYAQPKRTWAQLGLDGGKQGQQPQRQQQGLTVQQLTAKYGKPIQIDQSAFFGGTSQPKALSVKDLELKYGAPKEIDHNAFFGTQPNKTTSVQQLSEKYGAPIKIDPSVFFGTT